MSTVVRSITTESVSVAGITFDNMSTIFGTEESFGFDTSEYGYDSNFYGFISYEYSDGEAGIK